MEALASSELFWFEDFRLDRHGGGLSRRDDKGAFAPVAVGSRGLDVLGVLVARAGEVVSKDEIIAAVWPGTVVEDSNLTVQISALRRVIDQGRSDGSYIQTVSGRGYRFVAPVTHSVEGVRAATSISQPLFAPRLSIVVLPFANLSDDREQQYFSDGLTEDLTTDLSRISGSLVIARNTAFTYKGKAIDVKQIGRELGVRYVLEGSVRRSGDRVRVNAQLVDAETGVHLWAERFNRTASDLLEIQDDITLCIASELKAELVEAESKRAIREHPNNLDAIDLTMQARALSNKPPSPEQNAHVRELYEKALSIDPENVDALIGLANGYVIGMSDLGLFWDHDHEWKRRATDAVSRALAIEPRNARAFLVNSRLLAYCNELDYRGRLDEAIDAAEAAIALDPNLATAYGWLGRLYAKAGHPERTAASVQQAMRLSPRDPVTAGWLYQIGIAQLQMGHYDEAISTFRKSLVANPNLTISRESLSAAYLGSGREAKARSVLADIRREAAARMPDQLDDQLLLMRVQLVLLQQGFWPYNVNGRNRRLTAEALRAFQRKENLPETGFLDEVTLARLGVAEASVE
jgi:adenylate cyclase